MKANIWIQAPTPSGLTTLKAKWVGLVFLLKKCCSGTVSHWFLFLQPFIIKQVLVNSRSSRKCSNNADIYQGAFLGVAGCHEIKLTSSGNPSKDWGPVLYNNAKFPILWLEKTIRRPLVSSHYHHLQHAHTQIHTGTKESPPATGVGSKC